MHGSCKFAVHVHVLTEMEVKAMKTIHIYGDNRQAQVKRERIACRGILRRGEQILLSYEVNTDQWFTPGGGLEKNETLPECCARELAEETGCVVKAGEQFLTIHEYYLEWHFVSHYFLCEYVGETQRSRTEQEVEVG